MKQAIIMAAGKGTRMNSDLPKVAHKICGKTMVDCIIDELKNTGINNIVTILGYGIEYLENSIKDKTTIVEQKEQLGTAHAVMQANDLKDLDGYTLVINGDCPLITKDTFNKLIIENNDAGMVVLTVKLDDPKAYGRIVRNSLGYIEKIVEFKDCNQEEKLINEINTGIYCFDNKLLFKYLNEVDNNNAQNEYYITDLVAIMNKHNHKVKACISTNIEEVQGINSQVELANANAYKRKVINEYHMNNGVVIIDPNNTYIDDDVVIERQVTIHPNTYIKNKSIIKTKSIIESMSTISNSTIGENTIITSSSIINSTIGNNVTIGPFSHIREYSNIKDNCRIGNFVEMKKTEFNKGSKCAHLTYLGDSIFGERVNVGCGVVTVNYDGKNKFQTIVDDDAFIGSNCNLIAPVHIGKSALVAAGSTCTKDVNDGDMYISRSNEVIKTEYGYKYKKKV